MNKNYKINLILKQIKENLFLEFYLLNVLNFLSFIIK